LLDFGCAVTFSVSSASLTVVHPLPASTWLEVGAPGRELLDHCQMAAEVSGCNTMMWIQSDDTRERLTTYHLIFLDSGNEEKSVAAMLADSHQTRPDEVIQSNSKWYLHISIPCRSDDA